MTLDEAKELLLKSGKFKVLEKYSYQKIYENNTKAEPTETACLIDTETTALDHETAEVFNIGLVRFNYGLDTGTIFDIVEMYDGYQQPVQPIPKEIEELTGITNEMVKGQTFDNDKINRMLSDSKILIAHHAAFDRGMVDRRWPVSQYKIWYDSFTQVPWKSLGAKGGRLSDAAMLFDFWFDGHRALTDALATLHVLSKKINNVPVMQLMKKVGSEEYTNIIAHKAPFTANSKLRSANYKWDKVNKVWGKRSPNSELAKEELYLQNEVYSGGVGYELIPVSRVDLFKS